MTFEREGGENIMRLPVAVFFGQFGQPPLRLCKVVLWLHYRQAKAEALCLRSL